MHSHGVVFSLNLSWPLTGVGGGDIDMVISLRVSTSGIGDLADRDFEASFAALKPSVIDRD